MVARSVVLVALAIAGCNDHPLASSPLTHAREESGLWFGPRLRELDVLVVVDDSASMADEAPSIASLLRAFGSPDVQWDLRVGVTTTDTGNPACVPASAEDGALVATSCRERLDDFVTPGGVDGEAADVRVSACYRPCSLEELDLPVPWIEHGPYGSNLPPDVSFETAAACMVPQGVSGCAFESPLHAMRRVIERAWDPRAPEYDFRRPDASFLVMIVTDEDDCSVASGQEAPFDPAVQPTSAACLDATLADIDDSVRLLRHIEEIAAPFDRFVLVAPIVAVPTAYPNAPLEVPPPSDEDEAERFGVGASCRENGRVGHPPLRLLELASHFEYAPVSSTCAPEYFPPSELFPFERDPPPLCVETCVDGEDASAPTLQPACWLERRRGEDTEPLPRCEHDGDDWAIPIGAGTCWAPLVDKDAVTESRADDMSHECIEEGWNLEVRIVSVEPHPFDALHWTCEVADNREVACPDL